MPSAFTNPASPRVVWTRSGRCWDSSTTGFPWCGLSKATRFVCGVRWPGAECLGPYDRGGEVIITKNLKLSLLLGKEQVIVVCKFLLHGALNKWSSTVRKHLRTMVYHESLLKEHVHILVCPTHTPISALIASAFDWDWDITFWGFATFPSGKDRLGISRWSLSLLFTDSEAQGTDRASCSVRYKYIFLCFQHLCKLIS